MTRTLRVGTVVLVVALVGAFPTQALAQRGGEGWWDMIRELSGPRLNGIGLTAFEICLGFFPGAVFECPDTIRRERLEKSKRFREAVIAYLSNFGDSSYQRRAPLRFEPDSVAEIHDSLDRMTTELAASSFAPNAIKHATLNDGEIHVLLEQATLYRYRAGSSAIQGAILHDRAIMYGLAIFALEERLLRRLDEEGGRKPGYTKSDESRFAFRACLAQEVAVAALGSSSFLEQDAKKDCADVEELVNAKAGLNASPQAVLAIAYNAKRAPRFMRVLHPYLRANTGWSTGSAEAQGGSDDVNRFQLNPMFSVELESNQWMTLYGAAGGSINWFYGTGFKRFRKQSFDASGGVRFGRTKDLFYIDVGIRFHYFRTPFTSQEFGGPVEPVPDGGEWAWGPGIGFGIQFPAFSF